MRHLIPPNTKNKIQIVFGLTFTDLFIIALGIAFAALFFIANVDKNVKIIVSLVTFAIIYLLVAKIGELRGYQFIFYFIKFTIRKKKLENVSLKEGCGVSFDKNTVMSNNCIS